MKIISRLFLFIGIAILFFAAYQFYDYKFAAMNGLKEAETFIEKTPLSEFSSLQEMKEAAEAMQLTEGEAFAILKIPSIDLTLPIYEGTDLPTLRKGVGHHPMTGIPAEGTNIFLAGHNDSAFRNVGKIKKDDLLEIEMPYGTFQYTMKKTEIVMDTETSLITDKTTKEVLILSTCYPFYSIKDPVERYIVYADFKGFIPKKD